MPDDLSATSPEPVPAYTHEYGHVWHWCGVQHEMGGSFALCAVDGCDAVLDPLDHAPNTHTYRNNRVQTQAEAFAKYLTLGPEMGPE